MPGRSWRVASSQRQGYLDGTSRLALRLDRHIYANTVVICECMVVWYSTLYATRTDKLKFPNSIVQDPSSKTSSCSS